MAGKDPACSGRRTVSSSLRLKDPWKPKPFLARSSEIGSTGWQPAANNAVGVFTDLGLRTLYGDLVAQGQVSPAAALRVGATIEDLDIHDLDQALAATDNDDFRTAYQNLQEGSRNHMRAFVGQLEVLGETYVAQYIGAAALAEILASPHKAGMGNGRGGNGPMGVGRGNGTCLLGNTPTPNPGAGSRRPW